MALSVEDDLQLSDGTPNEYTVDADGNMWNGGILNLSDSQDAFDNIKNSAMMDITIFYGDTRYITTVIGENGQREVGTQAGQTVIDTVLNGGQEYFAENVDVVGQKYFAYYLPLYNDGSQTPVGMIFVGVNQESVDSSVNGIVFTVIAVGVILVILCSLVGFVVLNSIIRGLHAGIAVVNEVAEGNLASDIPQSALRSSDEIGDMTRAIDSLQKRLSGIIRTVNGICNDVNEASDSLNKETELSASHISQADVAVNEIAQGATLQAKETQQTTENVIVIGDMIAKNNEGVSTLSSNAENMGTIGDNALDTLKTLEGINGKAKDAIEVIYRQTNTTNESAQKIQEAVNLITDIAEETNLLSLNASIEAARAGEQGRGFAVVAGQIQNLAEQSYTSARKIKEIVVSLIEASNAAVDTMNEVRQIMNDQSDKVSKKSQMFLQLKDGIDQSVSAIGVIAESISEIDKKRIGVVDSAQNLTSIAEENAASTEETSATISELTEIMNRISEDANVLDEVVDKLHKEFQFFKTADEVQA